MIIERGNLCDIAARMRLFARLNPHLRGKPITSYRRALPRGLEITLLLEDVGEWDLEIARANVMPSPQEEAIIKREFGVPEDAERAERLADLVGGGQRGAVRWTWRAQSTVDSLQ